jgi:hypothetical protein
LIAYKGDIIADLFGEVSYFADVETFWVLQNAAIAGVRDELAAKGWKVTVLDKATRFPAWQYDEATMEDGGEAFIEIRAKWRGGGPLRLSRLPGCTGLRKCRTRRQWRGRASQSARRQS